MLMVECLRDECGWFGPADEAVHPKHDPDFICCPECHERAYPSESEEVGNG